MNPAAITPAPTGPAPTVDGPGDGAKQVNAALKKFLSARQGARRFHKEWIGDHDPAHCFGDWLGKVLAGDAAGIRKEYGASLDYAFGGWLDKSGCRSKAALASTSGVSGGYLVPPELGVELMQDVGEESFFRRFAFVQPMESATLNLAWPDATTASGTTGVPSWFGTMQMTWAIEAASRTESEPKFRQVSLKAWDLGGVCLGSRPLQQDSLGLEDWLRRLFARAVAWFEDFAFFQGNGLGKPLGVVPNPGTKQVTRAGGNAISLADVANMDAALLPASFCRAFWCCSPTALAKIEQLTAWQPNSAYDTSQRNELRIAGLLNHKPLVVTDKLPAVGTLGDLVLFDPSLYVVGDRMAVEVSASTEYPTVYGNSQVAWRVVERVDGQPVFGQTFTAADQTTILAAYVALN